MPNWFTVKKLKSSVYGIAEFKHFEEVISYLVVGEDKALLFDTGMGIGDMQKVVSEIADKPIIVVNSHTHFDHIGGNSKFSNVNIFGCEFSIKNAKNGIGNSQLQEYITKEQFFGNIPNDFNADSYKILPFDYSALKESQVIDIAPYKFEVLHTPGHSPDSICLYERSRKWLFSGDTLYNGPIFVQMEESDVDDYLVSIEKLLSLDLETVFAGHNEFIFDESLIRLIYKELLKKPTKEILVKDRLSILVK